MFSEYKEVWNLSTSIIILSLLSIILWIIVSNKISSAPENKSSNLGILFIGASITTVFLVVSLYKNL